MERFTDYKSILELKMSVWDSNSIGYSPDCSADIIDYIKYDNSIHAYVVDSVEAVIEYVRNWNKYETEDDVNENYASREYDKEHGKSRFAFCYRYHEFRIRQKYLNEFGNRTDENDLISLPDIICLAKERAIDAEDILDKCNWLEENV